MPRRGENIFKRADGRWEGRYIKKHNVAGKAVYGFVYAKSYKDIKEKLNSAKASAAELSKDITFEASAAQWIQIGSANLKESTCIKYRNLLKNHILPELGPCRISKMETAFLENYLCQKLESGRLDGKGGLSQKTVRDILSVIKLVLKHAKALGVVTSCEPGNIHIKVPEQSPDIFSREEQARLEKYLLEHISPRNAGILLSLYMGLRIGEVCALRWENINLTENILGVRGTMQRLQSHSENGKKTSVVITTPKSKCSIRDIPIPDFLTEVLTQLASDEPKAFFLTGEAEAFIEPRSFQGYYQKILLENGLGHFRYHALRHTFATRCVEAGFDIKSLSEILGHSTVNITLNRYVHASIAMKRKNMEKISVPLSKS